MTFRQIQYLQAICECGSISKAAEKLYIAQSSLSASIKDLEHEYGIILFERTSKGVSLTHQGEEFLKDVGFLSDFYQQIDDKYKSRQSERERFCVASHHHIIGLEAFEQLALALRDKHYRLGCLEGSTQFILESVENNQSDIGILFCTQSSHNTLMKEVNNRNIAFQHLGYRKFHAYVHKSHPLAGKDSLCLEDITEYPFVSYDENNYFSSRFTSSLHQWNKSRQLLFVTDRAMAYSLVCKVEAYFTGTGFLTQEEKNRGILAIPITDLEPVEVGWISKSNRLLPELAMDYLYILNNMLKG